MKATYTVIVEPDAGWWFIRVEELPGVFSQAKRLDRVESMARDAIATILDAPLDSFDVVIREHLSPEADEVLAQARSARAEASERQRLASETARTAVRALAQLGLPHRDIGCLLGISHQRVGQLLRDRAA